MVASDGVWDAFGKMSKVMGMSRAWPVEQAPSRMIQGIVRAYGGLRDDTSMVVADVLPPGGTFAGAAAAAKEQLRGGKAAVQGGTGSGEEAATGCGCFGGRGGAAAARTRRPLPSDVSVQSGGSSSAGYSNASAHAGHLGAAGKTPGARLGGLQILSDVDIAAILGLMPDLASPPAWCDDDIGESLLALAVEASELWRQVSGRRWKQPALRDEAVRRRKKPPKKEHSVHDDAGVGRSTSPPLPIPERRPAPVDVWAEASSQPVGDPDPEKGLGSMRRTGSLLFLDAVAEGETEYVQKFGHYKEWVILWSCLTLYLTNIWDGVPSSLSMIPPPFALQLQW
jgi:hypothetical protein